MTESLPRTIIYPEAFMRSLPPGFDGVMHWEYLNEVLRPYSGIQCCDVDSLTERNRLFLSIESKDCGVPIPHGQELRTLALLDTGLCTHIDIWGKEIPRAYRIRSFWDRESLITEGEDCRPALARVVAKWIKWASGINLSERDYRQLFAAWKISSPEARKRFAENILKPSLGSFDSTALGEWFSDSIKDLT